MLDRGLILLYLAHHVVIDLLPMLLYKELSLGLLSSRVDEGLLLARAGQL